MLNLTEPNHIVHFIFKIRKEKEKEIDNCENLFSFFFLVHITWSKIEYEIEYEYENENENEKRKQLKIFKNLFFFSKRRRKINHYNTNNYTNI